jgi:nicotinamidase-related amidase
MIALIVIDAQNEFSASGKRPVPNYSDAIEVIRRRVEYARQQRTPIAWVRHFNRPEESPAFMPGTWGAEYIPGFGPKSGSELENEFQKTVYGAFTGSNIGTWLTAINANEVLIVGFYTHACVSTTAREAIMAGYDVYIDPDATGAIAMDHALLGQMTADQIRQSALLQLVNMGVVIDSLNF